MTLWAALHFIQSAQTHTKWGERSGSEAVEYGKFKEVKVLLIGCSESDGFVKVWLESEVRGQLMEVKSNDMYTW